MTEARSRPRDFAGLHDRFLPQGRSPAANGSAYQFRPDSVRSVQPVINNRIQSRLRTSLPKVLTLIAGLLLLALGIYNSVGILTLRGNQYSFVNNLLLVFTGIFLVLVSLHEGYVARAQVGAQGL